MVVGDSEGLLGAHTGGSSVLPQAAAEGLGGARQEAATPGQCGSTGGPGHLFFIFCCTSFLSHPQLGCLELPDSGNSKLTAELKAAPTSDAAGVPRGAVPPRGRSRTSLGT